MANGLLAGVGPSVVSGINPSAPTVPTDNTTLAANFTTFLQLLTTQLQNHNPLDPLDTNQFTQQLVQFAPVAKQITRPANLDQLVSIEQSAQGTRAMAFVGTDVVINLTTGAGARFIPGSNDPMVPDPRSTMSTPAQRVRHVVELKPEICSLDMGSINMGNYAFVNTVPHIEEIATAIRDAGVTPEIEVFEPDHIALAKKILQTGHFKSPSLFQICLGVVWGTPATPDAMKFMKDMLPEKDCTWFTFGCGATQFPMVAQAMLYGGHVRVGLEDNLYLARGKLAPSTAALVEKAVSIIEVMGDDLATPAEARQKLDLRKAA